MKVSIQKYDSKGHAKVIEVTVGDTKFILRESLERLSIRKEGKSPASGISVIPMQRKFIIIE